MCQLPVETKKGNTKLFFDKFLIHRSGRDIIPSVPKLIPVPELNQPTSYIEETIGSRTIRNLRS